MFLPFRIVVWLVICAAFVMGGIALQVFLSRMDAHWPGLILPGLTLAYSLVMAFGMAAFSAVGEQAAAVPGWWLSVLMAVLVLNIPTLVLLAVYFVCRLKKRQDKLLEKMNIQDL